MKAVRAKKHLGQHFLNDQRIAKNITDLLSNETTFALEIGPGMGVLTQFLIKREFEMSYIRYKIRRFVRQIYIGINYKWI